MAFLVATVDMAVMDMAAMGMAMASIRVTAMAGTATRITAAMPMVAIVIAFDDGSWDEMAACSFAEFRYATE
ncbi:MAG: hypothetical protein AOY29_12545 [Alcanivorax borkumensis]|nr:MAG: hypothetical protein AOY29_12545 [Alcanivorax borkumensis]